MKTRGLLLARHGQSSTNARNVFTGWSDPPLTARGIEEAREIGIALARLRIRPGAIFSSALSRARHSAEIVRDAVAPDSHIICSPALNERDYGDLTGCNKDQIAARYGQALLHRWRRSWSAEPPGGESLRDTAARVLIYYVRSILPAAIDCGPALVVAHGNSLRALMIALENVAVDDAETIQIGTGAVRQYDLTPAGAIVDGRWLIDRHGVG